MSFEGIRSKVGRYYTERLQEHGTSARGVDWNSESSQILRFKQLARLLPDAGRFSVLDFGCGYGAMVPFLEASGAEFDYQGFDISAEMIERACETHGPERRFTASRTAVEPADYALASGIFNVRLDTAVEEWMDYVTETLSILDGLGGSGFAFNMLTSYSDLDRMRRDLFYADPCWAFDLCKRRFSKQVALLHDYGLYEFTVLVRR